MSSSMDKMAALILGGDNFMRDSMIPTLLDLAESRQYRIRHPCKSVNLLMSSSEITEGPDLGAAALFSDLPI